MVGPRLIGVPFLFGLSQCIHCHFGKT
jgi:hypothetical protein